VFSPHCLIFRDVLNKIFYYPARTSIQNLVYISYVKQEQTVVLHICHLFQFKNLNFIVISVFIYKVHIFLKGMVSF